MLCSGIQYYLLHFHDFHPRKYRTACHSWTRGVSFTMKDIAETYYSEGFSLIGCKNPKSRNKCNKLITLVES